MFHENEEEKVDSNLHHEDEEELKGFLKDFIAVVDGAFESAGVPKSKNPYGRPAHMLVVIDPENIHLVVEDRPVEGKPLHVYRNEHTRGALLPLDAIMETAGREIGFQKPIGLSFPNVMMKMPSADRVGPLTQGAGSLVSQLRERPDHTEGPAPSA